MHFLDGLRYGRGAGGCYMDDSDDDDYMYERLPRPFFRRGGGF